MKILTTALLLGSLELLIFCGATGSSSSNDKSSIVSRGNENNVSQPRPTDDEALVLDEIDRFAAHYSISGLRKKTLSSDQTEIRIWVGFSPNITRGLIIGRNLKLTEASYLPPIGENRKSKTGAAISKHPATGWDRLWADMNASAFMNLPDDPRVGKVEPYEDSDGVVVEVKTGEEYRWFEYASPCDSNTSEAKTLLSSLEMIGDRLGISFYQC